MFTPASIDFISGMPDPSASFDTNLPIEAEINIKKVPKAIHMRYLLVHLSD